MNGMHIHSFSTMVHVLPSTDPTYAKIFRANCRFLHKFTDLEMYSLRKEIIPVMLCLKRLARGTGYHYKLYRKRVFDTFLENRYG